MNKYWISAILIILGLEVCAQSVNIESGVGVDTSSVKLSTQRIEVCTDVFSIKYDHKSLDKDVFGVKVPKILSDSIGSIGAMLMKIGDGGIDDQFIFDLWAEKKFGKFNAMLELGRIVSQNSTPHDFIGSRLSCGNFTTETYVVASHTYLERLNSNDAVYTWLAYHPEHLFVSLGLQYNQRRQYWGMFGTKNFEKFGNFTFLNYQPESGNFWFRSQAGFGEIDQSFFSQDLYIFASSYLIVPAFFFQHFSPISSKGSYSLKLDGRRTNGVHNYELIMGKKVGNDFVRMAVGVNSEYRDNLRLAPSIELYKDWKGGNGRIIVELRYDLLYKNLNAYLVVRY